MAFDIFGENLSPGHCEAHPYVHEEYPCSVCIAEKQRYDSMKEHTHPIPDELIDKHLDRVLRAAGSGLHNYTMEKTKSEMRSAMRDAMMEAREK